MIVLKILFLYILKKVFSKALKYILNVVYVHFKSCHIFSTL